MDETLQSDREGSSTPPDSHCNKHLLQTMDETLQSDREGSSTPPDSHCNKHLLQTMDETLQSETFQRQINKGGGIMVRFQMNINRPIHVHSL